MQVKLLRIGLQGLGVLPGLLRAITPRLGHRHGYGGHMHILGACASLDACKLRFRQRHRRIRNGHLRIEQGRINLHQGLPLRHGVAGADQQTRDAAADLAGHIQGGSLGKTGRTQRG